MKKAVVLLTGLFLLVFAANTQASSRAASDVFAGKWNILVSGTPSGDVKMVVLLERVDGKLKAEFVGEGQSEKPKVFDLEEKENSVKIYFSASGYDVYLHLVKKGDDHVEGTMLDMFDAKGDRVTE